LVVGIVVVPILTALGIFVIQRSMEKATYPVPDYDEIAQSSGGMLERKEWEELADFIARRKSDLNFIVIGNGRQVIYSTTEDIATGTVVDDRRLMETIRTTSERYRYLFDSPVRLHDKETLVLMRLDRLPNGGPPGPVARFLSLMLYVLAALFVFSAVMSILIARSIYRSVTVLEAGTRRIAEGELDVAVDAKGSNEITSLTASLNRMRLALKDEETRRARFIMGVSHDLKTPLALIKGYAEAIGDGMAEDPESLDKSVEIIGSKVDQLEGMIDDLIGFVKVDTGEWRRKLESVPLAAFLAAYGKRVSADAELLDRRVDFRIDLPSELAVPMDERLVLRALENLVNNALRYTAASGRVLISARIEGERALVEIEDDGPGMGAEELTRIFDPFYRGSASRREPGMGLGLSVVKGVVDSHGWDIKVSSEKGKGSVFCISIPLQESIANLDEGK
jgi:signal transduction histidine kinase